MVAALFSASANRHTGVDRFTINRISRLHELIGRQHSDAPLDSTFRRPNSSPAWFAAISIGLALGLVALVLLEAGAVWEFAGDTGALVHRLIPRMGPAASVIGIYLEESGVPLPVPGDVFVLYLGHALASSAALLIAAWAGLVAAVVAGASNLYLISRIWGRRVVEGRIGTLLHVTPERLRKAELAFDRWGVLALVLGRHVIGLRVPLTVAAGILRIPYPVFASSVAVSSGVWAAIWLGLGVRFGGRLVDYTHLHRWMYVAVPAGFWLAVVIWWVIQRRLGHGSHDVGAQEFLETGGRMARGRDVSRRRFSVEPRHPGEAGPSQPTPPPSL